MELLKDDFEALFLGTNTKFTPVIEHDSLKAFAVSNHFTNQPAANKDLLDGLTVPLDVLDAYFNLFFSF